MIIILLMIGLTFINGTIEQVYLAGGEISTLNTLLGTDVGMGERMSAFWSMLWFDYAMFEGEWAIVRYIFMSISASVLLVIVFSVVSNISSFARRFFTGGV